MSTAASSGTCSLTHSPTYQHLLTPTTLLPLTYPPTHVSRRPKFVFFMLAGPAVPVRTRTRGLLDMGAIAAVLQVRGNVVT